MKQFSKEELARNNGKNGTPAFFAHNGKVYDVSKSILWENGDHQGLHDAGKDLTEELASAPHGSDVLDRFSVIGTINED